MPSPQSQWVSHLLRRLVKAPSQRKHAVSVVRLTVEAAMRMAHPVPRLSVEATSRGEWLRPETAPPEAVILYFHGGGYFFCSPRTHRQLTVRLAQTSGLSVFAARYRLAPEHPYPAALEDALAHYQDLAALGCRVVLAGDSAGGGLALATLLALRERGLPQPACAVCFSPWTDLAHTGDSLHSNDQSCVMFSGDSMRRCADYYLAGTDPRTPLVSPLYADLTDLPPLLLHVSDSELLLDDSLRLAEKARQSGVDVTLKVWRRQPHAWQLFSHVVPEGRHSLEEAGHYARRQLGLEALHAGLSPAFHIP